MRAVSFEDDTTLSFSHPSFADLISRVNEELKPLMKTYCILFSNRLGGLTGDVVVTLRLGDVVTFNLAWGCFCNFEWAQCQESSCMWVMIYHGLNFSLRIDVMWNKVSKTVRILPGSCNSCS